MKYTQLGVTTQPAIGSYQWNHNDSIMGYCSTKEEAKKLAIDYAKQRATKGFSSDWSVAEVIDTFTHHKDTTHQAGDGTGRMLPVTETNMCVLVSVVAFGTLSISTTTTPTKPIHSQGYTRA